MARDVGDFADTVRGQLSYCTHLLNAYTECIYSASKEDAIEVLSDISKRLSVAQNNVNSMIEAYGHHERNTTRNLAQAQKRKQTHGD